jgi:hypothetical protein
MDPYHPSWHAQNPDMKSLPLSMNRKITAYEYRFAIHCARDFGLHRGL